MPRRCHRTQSDGAMRAVVRGIAWLGILIGVCLAPLGFALMSTNRPGQGFWTDFSVALGFVGLSLMGVDFALVARVKPIAEPFGTDALVDFHRQIECSQKIAEDDAGPFRRLIGAHAIAEPQLTDVDV